MTVSRVGRSKMIVERGGLPMRCGSMCEGQTSLAERSLVERNAGHPRRRVEVRVAPPGTGQQQEQAQAQGPHLREVEYWLRGQRMVLLYLRR